jgi:hypothetical protein
LSTGGGGGISLKEKKLSMGDRRKNFRKTHAFGSMAFMIDIPKKPFKKERFH